MEIGETLQQCVKEESSLGIYTNPNHVIAYSDGEVRQGFNITCLGRTVGGNLTVSCFVPSVGQWAPDREPVR
ncbi:hypothetical protein ACWDV4_14220 [Micromonospora sp. NPDC003197]